MSTVTKTIDSLFDGVSQTSTSKTDWLSLSQILSASTYAAQMVCTILTKQVGEDVFLTMNKGVSNDATISNIRLYGTVYYGNGSPTNPPLYLDFKFDGASTITRSDSVPSSPLGSFEMDGDLAYWGLTNAEAINFLNGNSNLQMNYEDNVSELGSYTIYARFLKLEVDYTDYVPGSINLGAGM